MKRRQINVNGSSTHPVFQFLKQRLKGSFGDFIKWCGDVLRDRSVVTPDQQELFQVSVRLPGPPVPPLRAQGRAVLV